MRRKIRGQRYSHEKEDMLTKVRLRVNKNVYIGIRIRLSIHEKQDMLIKTN